MFALKWLRYLSAWDRLDGREAIPVIARGRGYTHRVVGESYHQSELERVAGRKTEDGHKKEIVANLLVTPDRSVIEVRIKGLLVGYLPAEQVPDMLGILDRLAPGKTRLQCDAKIVGGWDRGGGDQGHFGVKLSLSQPVRLKL